MEAKEAQKIISEFLRLMYSVGDTYDANYDIVGRTNEETQDLLHEMELGNLNAVQLTQTAKRLKVVRQERRKFTNENRYLKHIKDFTKGNPQFIARVKQLSFNLQNVTDTIGAEVYTPRVCRDLKLCSGGN